MESQTTPCFLNDNDELFCREVSSYNNYVIILDAKGKLWQLNITSGTYKPVSEEPPQQSLSYPDNVTV